MWLEGYRSISSDVYFGTSQATVEAADRNSPEYRGNQVNNIFSPGELQADLVYYWRIDAVKEEKTVKGDVWSFTAGIDANPDVYKAMFRVFGLKNGETFPLEGALIGLGERKGLTGGGGSAIITLIPEGMYQLQVTNKGYTGISDSLYITSDTLFLDTLEHTTYDLTFIVKDKESGETIEGADILFEDHSLITDSSGIVELPDLDYGFYNVTASAPGYYPSDSIIAEIYSDTTMEIILVRKYLQVSFLVVDMVDGNPLSRAKIIYEDQLTLTNTAGEAVLDNLSEGAWSFTIEHNDYFTMEETILIQADTIIKIRMTPKLASIQFEISGEAGPLEGAMVELDGALLLVSDGDGAVKFLNRQARRNHFYSITKEGYEMVYDSLFLEIDTLLKVILQPLTITEDATGSEIRVFPNPADNDLFIDTGGNPGQFSVIGPLGKELIEGRSEGEVIRVDMSGIEAGIYLIRIISEQGENSFRAILKHKNMKTK